MPIQISRDDYNAAPWMRVAHGHLGLHELTDAGELNPVVRGFFDHTNFPPALITKRTAWCAAFACTCLEEVQIVSPHSAGARHFETWGYALQRPVWGCIAVFRRGPDRTKRRGSPKRHVGFVDTVGRGEALIFGGNQDNRAKLKPYPLADLVALRWPYPLQDQPRRRSGQP